MTHTLASEFVKLRKFKKFYTNVSALEAMKELQLSRDKSSKYISNFMIKHKESYQTINIPGTKTFNNNKEHINHVFYIHGGGLVFHDLKQFEGLLSFWSEISCTKITGFSYPKAPEHSFYEIYSYLESLIRTYIDFIDDDKPIVLVGDSIGGYLALALAQNSFKNIFSRIILIYPVLDIFSQRDSWKLYGRNYFLDDDYMYWFQSLVKTNNFFGDYNSFDTKLEIPIYLYSCEYDILRDDAIEWAETRKKRNLPLCHTHFEDLPHEFCLYAGFVPEALKAVEKIAKSFII